MTRIGATNDTNFIKYFDIHSHLNFPQYDSDRQEVINRMKENGVATITIGTSYETSKSAVELAENHLNLYASIGIHPVGEEFSVFEENDFETLIGNPKVVVIGECGLDYGKNGEVDEDEKGKQKKLFEKQIDFAVKWNKPLMLHGRNSTNDILDILSSKKKGYGEKLRGNAHFFTGDIDQARKFFDLDFSISLTGVITFVRDYDEVVRYAPLEMIMSETDAPFVSPIPYRGKRNEPIYVIEVVKKIAELKHKEIEEISLILKENAFAKFNLV